MQASLFYTAKEIQDMLGVSRGKAYQVVRELNMQLQEMGFIIVPGKVPKQFFHEHFYGMATHPITEVAAQLV